MHRSLIALSAVFLLTAGGASAADDAVRNGAERVRDRSEIRNDRRTMRDDLSDRKWVEDTLAAFLDARGRKDSDALRLLDDRVAGYLASETAEAKREQAKAKAEARRGRRELRSDRRDVRENRRQDVAVDERVDDHRDRRDDRRDLRDDRRDVAVEAAQSDRLTAIRDEWKELEGDLDGRALDRREDLLRELVVRAGGEVVGNAVERSEDRRELREDRRETREDRHED